MMTRAITLILVLFAAGIPSRPIAAQERLPWTADSDTHELATEGGSAIAELPSQPTANFEPSAVGTLHGEAWTLEEGETLLEEPANAPNLERRALGPGGGPGMGGPGGMMGGGGLPGYEATWYPSQAVSGQSGDLGLVRQSLSLGAPVWHGETEMVLASMSIRNSLFSTDAFLPDSLRPFPHQLWSVNFGLNYMRQFDNGWSGGLMGGFGSASDEPFHSIEELTANLGAFLRVPARNGQDSWQFIIMYMYGGPVDFPIPMLSYAWNPSDQLRVNLGLPFSIAWQPSAVLTLNLSYMPLNNINARFTYRMAPSLQAYGGYEFLNESYFLADRTDLQDRFFAFEQRLIAGLRWEAWRNAACELNAGYSFGRNYGQGASQWGSLSDRVDVDPGPFLGLSFRLRF